MALLVLRVICLSFCLHLSVKAQSICPNLVSSQVKDRAHVYMDKLQPLMGKTFSTEQDATDNRYQIAICSQTQEKCPQNSQYASAIRKNKKSDTDCSVIGRYNVTKVLGNDGWILLKYYRGDSVRIAGNITIEARTQIMITCDPDDHSGSLRVVEAELDSPDADLFYWFELKTEAICNKKSGLSTGSILCILFFTSAGIYFLFGFLYSRFIVGAQGLEQIPNYSLWKNFGKLQVEGCDFACRCGERQEAKMYRGIGENSEDRNRSGRDDRDDHLLPM